MNGDGYVKNTDARGHRRQRRVGVARSQTIVSGCSSCDAIGAMQPINCVRFIHKGISRNDGPIRTPTLGHEQM